MNDIRKLKEIYIYNNISNIAICSTYIYILTYSNVHIFFRYSVPPSSITPHIHM